MIGFFLGLLLGYLFIVNSNHSKTSKVCIFLTVSLFVNIAYYTIIPKSKYMLQYLNTKEQNEAWLNIYKHMKYRNIFGMLLGALGYLLIGNGLC